MGESETLISTDLMGILGLSPELRTLLDKKSILEFLSCHFIMENRTLFNGIKLVNEGTFTTIDCETQTLKQDSWLNFPAAHEEKPLEYWIERVSEVLSLSIQKRLSLKCGLYLSGGMDSRVVLASIPNTYRRKMTAVTIGVEGAVDCRIAKRVARRFQINLHHLVLDTEMFTDNFLKHIWLSGGISNHMVAPIAPAAASINVDRIFDGFAGDAQFGGGFHDTTHELDDGHWIGDPSAYILERIIQKGYIRPMDEIQLVIPNQSSGHILTQLRNSISGELSRFPPNMSPSIIFEMILFRLRAKGNTLGGQISADSICPVMKPFYDLDFANTIMKIPSRLRRKHLFYNYYVKAVMPAALADTTTTILPLEKQSKIIRFIKRGLRFIARKFGVKIFEKKGWIPIDKWIRENKIYSNWMKTILLDKRTIARGFIDPDGIKELLRKEIILERNVAMTLVNAVDLELILRLYSDGDGFELFVP
jgi:asparagine synthetase B (glutamine-hydrolysing)